MNPIDNIIRGMVEGSVCVLHNKVHVTYRCEKYIVHLYSANEKSWSILFESMDINEVIHKLNIILSGGRESAMKIGMPNSVKREMTIKLKVINGQIDYHLLELHDAMQEGDRDKILQCKITLKKLSREQAEHKKSLGV